MPTESFFNFFDPPSPPQDDDDASSDIEERLELDYQLGEDIKEKLIPRAIDWFTGEALQYENFEDFDEGEFETRMMKMRTSSATTVMRMRSQMMR